MLHARRGKIPAVFLRAAGVYDDDGRSAFLAQQISQIYEHRLISHFYPGMLCAAQSSVHRDDLADAVLRLVDRRHELPSELPLLVGEPDPPGYVEIQDIVGEALHGEGWKTIRPIMAMAEARSTVTSSGETVGAPVHIAGIGMGIGRLGAAMAAATTAGVTRTTIAMSARSAGTSAMNIVADMATKFGSRNP